VRAVFAPDSRQQPGGLIGVCKKYESRSIWLRKSETAKWSLSGRDGDDLAHHFADYVGWLKSRKGTKVRHTADQVRSHLQRMLRQQEQRDDLKNFVAMQVAVTKAIFNFREAWQGPPVAIFDAQRIFSSLPVSRYDILHLYAYYRLRLLSDKAEFERLHGPAEEAKLYVELAGQLQLAERLQVGLSYSSPWPEAEFRDRCCRSATALRGLRLSAQDGGGSAVMVPGPIRACIEDDWVPCLVVHQESWPALFSVLRGTPFYPRKLAVDFPTEATREYLSITGVAAFHVLPELNRHFYMLDRKLDDGAIWC